VITFTVTICTHARTHTHTYLCNETGSEPAEQSQFEHSSEEMSQHLKELHIQGHLHEVEHNLLTRLLLSNLYLRISQNRSLMFKWTTLREQVQSAALCNDSCIQ
jgi:hypothetical protein